ncbi:MAG: hypothetical protein BGO69_15770 [Bacteroidetes bacterium 46-16]|nr:MAG: hypothetical protein BGO69_15770 [Bacteroidetes bacterium 46-16]
MTAPVIVSIIALLVSSFSIGWQIFTYFDNKKVKLEIVTHYELTTFYDKRKTTSAVFNIINHSTKKTLIRTMWFDLIMDDVEPDRKDFIKTKMDFVSRKFPILLEPNDFLTENYQFTAGVNSVLKVNPKATNISQVAIKAKTEYRECRLVVIDIKGKEFKSKWVNINLTRKELEKFNPIHSYIEEPTEENS